MRIVEDTTRPPEPTIPKVSEGRWNKRMYSVVAMRWSKYDTFPGRNLLRDTFSVTKFYGGFYWKALVCYLYVFNRRLFLGSYNSQKYVLCSEYLREKITILRHSVPRTFIYLGNSTCPKSNTRPSTIWCIKFLPALAPVTLESRNTLRKTAFGHKRGNGTLRVRCASIATALFLKFIAWVRQSRTLYAVLFMTQKVGDLHKKVESISV